MQLHHRLETRGQKCPSNAHTQTHTYAHTNAILILNTLNSQHASLQIHKIHTCNTPCTLLTAHTKHTHTHIVRHCLIQTSHTHPHTHTPHTRTYGRNIHAHKKVFQLGCSGGVSQFRWSASELVFADRPELQFCLLRRNFKELQRQQQKEKRFGAMTKDLIQWRFLSERSCH